MRPRIGFRNGWPCFTNVTIAEKVFNQALIRAQLDKCDELVEKSSNPEVVKLAQRYIENWRKEVE